MMSDGMVGGWFSHSCVRYFVILGSKAFKEHGNC